MEKMSGKFGMGTLAANTNGVVSFIFVDTKPEKQIPVKKVIPKMLELGANRGGVSAKSAVAGKDS